MERLLYVYGDHFMVNTRTCVGPSRGFEPEILCLVVQCYSGIARGGLGGSNPSIRIEAVFFTAVKLLLLNIITSL